MSDIRGLAYLEVQAADLNRWREFALEGIGWARGRGPDADALYLRMDERRARLIVRPGEADRVLAVGWEARDQFALARVRAAAGDVGGRGPAGRSEHRRNVGARGGPRTDPVTNCGRGCAATRYSASSG